MQELRMVWRLAGARGLVLVVGSRKADVRLCSCSRHTRRIPAPAALGTAKLIGQSDLEQL